MYHQENRWYTMIGVLQSCSTVSIIFLSRAYGENIGLLIKGIIDISTGLVGIIYLIHQGWSNRVTWTLMSVVHMIAFTSGLWFATQALRNRGEQSLIIFLSSVAILLSMGGLKLWIELSPVPVTYHQLP